MLCFTSSNRDFLLRKPKSSTTGNVSRTTVFHWLFFRHHFPNEVRKSNEVRLCYWLFVVYNWFKIEFKWNYWAEWIVLSSMIDSFFQRDKINRSSVSLTRDLKAKGSQVGYCQKAETVCFISLIIASWTF